MHDLHPLVSLHHSDTDEIISIVSQRNLLGGPQNAKFWDLPCFPHIICIVGDHLEIDMADHFVRDLASLMSYSTNAQQLWREIMGSSFKGLSKTRWYSKFVTGEDIAKNIARLPEFLRRCGEEGYGMKPIVCMTVDYYQYGLLYFALH